VRAVLLAGCSSRASEGVDACRLDKPAEVVAQPEVTEVSASMSNVGLDVQSTLEERVRATVRLAGALALDIHVPGTDAECAHQPVYRHAYQLPRGKVVVTATTDRGQHERTTVTVGDRRRWVVVLVQDGFPLRLETWGSQPGWE
jgi:hypothetical protein